MFTTTVFILLLVMFYFYFFGFGCLQGCGGEWACVRVGLLGGLFVLAWESCHLSLWFGFPFFKEEFKC